VKADALIRGGLGDDTLSGGGRRNVLVGGAGSDTLVGDSQGDVLIGGEVTDDDALDAAFAAWIGDGSYHSRASAVGSTLSGQIVDDEFDLLTGLGSLDLFFHSDDDVSDGHGSEVATTV
jgi:Ca2+-binding RTX toxin-like protein